MIWKCVRGVYGHFIGQVTVFEGRATPLDPFYTDPLEIEFHPEYIVPSYWINGPSNEFLGIGYQQLLGKSLTTCDLDGMHHALIHPS